MQNKKLLLVLSFLGIYLLTAFPVPHAQASIIDNLVDSVKNLTSSKTSTSGTGNLIVDAHLDLAPDGDTNNDGIINGGDIVRFSYIITNDSDNDYPFTTLKTNIPRDSINYVHNIQGAYSIEDRSKSIEIPNLYIHAHQNLSISFDARVTSFEGNDKNINTKIEVFDKQNKKLTESVNRQLKTKALSSDKRPSILQSKLIDNNVHE